MISSPERDFSSLRELERSYALLTKVGHTQVSPEEFYWHLDNNLVVSLDKIEEGMTYRIHINDLSISDEVEFSPADCYYVTGRCIKVFKFGGEVLLAKFNISGGSVLVRGNYGLLYYCTNIVH